MEAKTENCRTLSSKAVLFAFIVCCAVMPFLAVPQAYGVTLQELGQQYQAAVARYEMALGNQAQNQIEIDGLNNQIGATENALADSKERLARTVKSLYIGSKGQNSLLELLMNSSSFSDAVMRYDTYARIQKHYSGRIDALVEEQGDLNAQKASLEQRKQEIESELSEALQAVDAAEDALEKAKHLDGDKYHQVQGNGDNCGATAVAVGTNILLGEERFKDNVEVWKSPGFDGDSTSGLAARAQKWLESEGLSDRISVTELPGDIHKTDELKDQLEQGFVVVISAGSGSVWHYADGSEKGADAFPDGHWIVFYRYADGVFYANDSSSDAKLGAGCKYTVEQMQAWLDGRGNHFATVMKPL